LGRSNNSRGSRNRDRGRAIVDLDRVAIGGLVLGLAMYVMPFWRAGRLRWAFAVTLVATVLHVYTSHRRSP
jgi:hypothetical protein